MMQLRRVAHLRKSYAVVAPLAAAARFAAGLLWSAWPAAEPWTAAQVAWSAWPAAAVLVAGTSAPAVAAAPTPLPAAGVAAALAPFQLRFPRQGWLRRWLPRRWLRQWPRLQLCFPRQGWLRSWLRHWLRRLRARADAPARVAAWLPCGARPPVLAPGCPTVPHPLFPDHIAAAIFIMKTLHVPKCLVEVVQSAQNMLAQKHQQEHWLHMKPEQCKLLRRTGCTWGVGSATSAGRPAAHGA